MTEKQKIKWVLRLWRRLGRIPLRRLYRLSDFLAWVVRDVVRYRREVVDHNLEIAFPELTRQERRKIAKDFYSYFCDLILEAPRMMTWSVEEMKEHITFEGIEQIREDTASGRNFTLYIGHYGQWEWIPSIALWLPGVTCAQIYSQLHDPVSDQIILANRQAHGSKSVEMRDTLRYILSAKQSGKPFGVGYVADQSPSADKLHHYIDFFGRQVPTHVGAEKITRRLNLTAYFLDMHRERRGYWRVRVIPMPYDKEDDQGGFTLTQQFYVLLEEMIRREPAYYLWSHKRFKYEKR